MVDVLRGLATKLSDNQSDDLRELKASPSIKECILHVSATLENGWRICAALLESLNEKDEKKYLVFLKST